MKNKTSISKNHFIIGVVFIILLSVTVFISYKFFQLRSTYHSDLSSYYSGKYFRNWYWEKSLEHNNIYNDNVILFYGDSQIALWEMATFFGWMPIKNRGISGKLATQSVERFKKEIDLLKPKTTVILIGTNDLVYDIPNDTIVNSLYKMMEISKDDSIEFFICSLLPVNYKISSGRSLEDLQYINEQLKLLSLNNGATYIDFYSRLGNDEGFFKPELTNDGLHPNQQGYYEMTKILRPLLGEYSPDFKIPELK